MLLFSSKPIYQPMPTSQPASQPTSQPASQPTQPTQPPSHPTPPTQPACHRRGGSVSYARKWQKMGGVPRVSAELTKHRILRCLRRCLKQCILRCLLQKAAKIIVKHVLCGVRLHSACVFTCFQPPGWQDVCIFTCTLVPG